MFLGVVPKECLEQIVKIMPPDNWSDAYVCCSGTFRLDRCLNQAYPSVRVHSNDVSLFSSVIGGLATGKPVDFRFQGELQFVEDVLGEMGATPTQRAGAVMVAFEMARFCKRNNTYSRRHYEYYQANFAEQLTQAAAKVSAMLEQVRIEDYFAGDWLKHAETAIEHGGMIFAFPPFWRGGYEKQFAFLDANIGWTSPEYPVWDPKDLRKAVQSFQDRRARYCVLTDQLWDDHEPALLYTKGGRLAHYCYASTDQSSLRRMRGRSAPFKYRIVDPAALTKDSKVEVVPAKSQAMNFIKDVYLSKSIIHASGEVNYLVFVDGALAGGMIYSQTPNGRAMHGPRVAYLLSDFAITPKGRIAKLIAMLSTSAALVRAIDLMHVTRIERLMTTAFSKHPDAMKYRGAFKRTGRKEAKLPGAVWQINYEAAPRPETPQEIYAEWWRKNGGKH